VSKPFEPQALVALVHALLDRDRPRGPESPEPAAEARRSDASRPGQGRGARRSDAEVFDTLERAFAEAGLSDEAAEVAPAPSPAAGKAPDGHARPGTAEVPVPEVAPVAATTVGGTASAPVRAPAMLAAAFTTLLAHERGRLPTDPASEREPTARDALVEEVSRRVVERLMPAGDTEGADRRLSEIVRRVVREELGRQDA
jgi:hypothetical protein